MALEIRDKFLSPQNYYPQRYPKKTIFLHHTAGAHNPVSTILAWNGDAQGRVATAFVIGNKSADGNNAGYDGKVYRCFDESQWAYHLGMPDSGGRVDKSAIGIEICSFGFLKRNGSKFFTYVNTEFTNKMGIAKLAQPFRGYRYFQSYSDAQLESLRALLLDLSKRFQIDLKLGLQEWIKKEKLKMPSNMNTTRKKQQWLRDHNFVGKDGMPIAVDGILGVNTGYALASIGKSAFEFNAACFYGAPGLWSHTNVRTDKWDCFPQENLKELILSF